MIGSVTSVCTECAVNNHPYCGGWAVDYATDQWQECPCWCRTVQDRTPSRPRGGLVGRVLGALDAWLGPRDPATRCAWTTPGNGLQCDRKTGHKRLCRTLDEDGRTQHWIGINYPKGGLP